MVVVPFRVVLLGKQLFFVTVFDAGWTSDARAKLEDSSVVSHELVGIARYIRTRPHEAHLPDEYIK